MKAIGSIEDPDKGGLALAVLPVDTCQILCLGLDLGQSMDDAVVLVTFPHDALCGFARVTDYLCDLALTGRFWVTANAGEVKYVCSWQHSSW